MIDVNELVHEVLLVVPGCPDFTAEAALQRAARHLCQSTHVWRHTTATLPVIEGLREVSLDLPDGATVARVFWAKLDGEPLGGVSASRISTDHRRPTGYAIAPSGVLMLDALPETNYLTNGVELHCSLMPMRGSSEVADDLDGFLEAIVAKATADLLSMPAREWRDRAGAADAYEVYQSFLLEAKRHGEQYNQPIRRAVKYGGI